MYGLLEPFCLSAHLPMLNQPISNMIFYLRKDLGLLPCHFESIKLIGNFECKRFHILVFDVVHNHDVQADNSYSNHFLYGDIGLLRSCNKMLWTWWPWHLMTSKNGFLAIPTWWHVMIFHDIWWHLAKKTILVIMTRHDISWYIMAWPVPGDPSNSEGWKGLTLELVVIPTFLLQYLCVFLCIRLLPIQV